MTVEQLMTKEVRTCGPRDTLAAAAHQMWDGDCGALPVVDGAERRVVGIITDRDICMAGCLDGRPLGQIPVEGVMSRAVKCCDPGDELETAEAVMRSARVRRLPVVDASGQILGMLSLADIAREAGRKGRGRRPACSPAEVAETVAAIVQPHRELVATQG
jgi:CBS-domain-containing membrane protein